MTHPLVADLLSDCPFLAAPLQDIVLLDADDFEFGTVVFGAAAGLLKERRLSPEQADAVFAHFNTLAERGDPDTLDVLGTGAIEFFNDDATSQRQAREKLKGRALEILEELRESWGQPDYGCRA